MPGAVFNVELRDPNRAISRDTNCVSAQRDSPKGSQALGVDGFTGVAGRAGFAFGGVEPGVTSTALMAGFAVSLPGRRGGRVNLRFHKVHVVSKV